MADVRESLVRSKEAIPEPINLILERRERCITGSCRTVHAEEQKLGALLARALSHRISDCVRQSLTKTRHPKSDPGVITRTRWCRPVIFVVITPSFAVLGYTELEPSRGMYRNRGCKEGRTLTAPRGYL